MTATAAEGQPLRGGAAASRRGEGKGRGEQTTANGNGFNGCNAKGSAGNGFDGNGYWSRETPATERPLRNGRCGTGEVPRCLAVTD